jgi:hypothetical protein
MRGVGQTRAFRGFHALATAALFVLFASALRCQRWEDVSAAAFALTVLAGLHTAVGMFGEAYPVNHFLLIAIYLLAVYRLAISRGGAWTGVAALVLFSVASLTLESGVVLFPVAAVGYISGARGISRRAIWGMAVLIAAYAALRVGYLHMSSPAIGERPVGFGLSTLDEEAIRQRFSPPPIALGAYSVLSSVLTVLLSQPIAGTWSTVRSWLNGSLHAFEVIAILTSLVTTLVIGRYLVARDASGRRGLWDPAATMTITAICGGAALSYAYTKSEVMSAAGVLYALLTYHAVRRFFTSSVTWTSSTRQAMVIVLMLTSCGWAMRAFGLQYRLERYAFLARNEWVHDDRYSLEAHTESPLESSLRRQALRRVGTNPYLMPRVAEDLWGTE